MAIKVLLQEGLELRLRLPGETHTSLQLFRQRLDGMKNVDYVNYFLGHRELDEPELFVRVTKGNDPADILRELSESLSAEFSDLQADLNKLC